LTPRDAANTSAGSPLFAHAFTNSAHCARLRRFTTFFRAFTRARVPRPATSRHDGVGGTGTQYAERCFLLWTGKHREPGHQQKTWFGVSSNPEVHLVVATAVGDAVSDAEVEGSSGS
jgi:hypothetical protein